MSKKEIQSCLEKGGFVSSLRGIESFCAFMKNDGTVEILDEGIEMNFSLDNATMILSNMDEVVLNMR